MKRIFLVMLLVLFAWAALMATDMHAPKMTRTVALTDMKSTLVDTVYTPAYDVKAVRSFQIFPSWTIDTNRTGDSIWCYLQTAVAPDPKTGDWRTVATALYSDSFTTSDSVIFHATHFARDSIPVGNWIRTMFINSDTVAGTAADTATVGNSYTRRFKAFLVPSP